MEIEFRQLTLDDTDTICRHRKQMFSEAGSDEKLLEQMAVPYRKWLAEQIANKTYFGFLAISNNLVVGGIGMMIIDWPPHPLHPKTAKRGYVLDVYVSPDYRRNGIAQTLLNKAQAEFSQRGITYLILHATDAGKPLYEKNGWKQTPEYAKSLDTCSHHT